MKKLSLLLMCAIMSVAANAQESVRAVKSQTWYGDNMGSTSNDTPTKEVDYLYGVGNRVERRIQTGLMEGGSWILTNYYRYDYNDADQLEMTNSLQYGIYDVNSYAFKAANDTVDYEYDEKGQLAKELTRCTNSYNTYEYDEDGNVVKKTIYKNGKYSQTLTYSDFVFGGPQTVKAESTQSYNCYDGEMTYDSFGNKLSELHYSTTGTLTSAEYWTADETGFVTLYEKKGISSGKEVDATKVEYTKIDEDNVKAQTFTYSKGEWYAKGGSTCVTSYAQFNAAAYAPVISNISTDNNAATVTFDIKAPTATDVSSFNVYRNGILVGNVNADATSYTDIKVPNGSQEYFIQSVVGEEGKNVSNVLATDMERNFPHATNFHATTARKTTEGIYMVTVAWKNPTLTDDIKFVNSNVMKVGTYSNSPLLDTDEVITDPTVNTIEVSFSIDPVQTIYLRTQYEGGSAVSNTITVDANALIGKVEEDNKQLRVVETYGDAMGEDMGITKKEITFYGDDNRVQRVAKYAKTVGADGDDPASWTISSLTRNIYGESGMLEKQYTQQYGRYDYGNMGFREASDTTYYENNVEGQVVKETNGYGYTTYEYDTDGNLTKKYIVEYGTENHEQTITYSNFVGKDKPRHTESNGTLTSYKYFIDTAYDENGKKLSEKTSSWSNTYNEYRASKYELLVYGDDGELQSDTIYKITISNDIEKYTTNSVTTYEAEENNPNRIKVVKKVWDTILKKFGNPKTWNVYEYTDINASEYSPLLAVEPKEDERNTVTLSVSIPDDMQSAMTALNIYRNGIEIEHAVNYFDGRYYTTDEYGMNGKFVYTDEKVRNGLCDYFVELAELDATMEKEAQVHNISNVVFYNFYTPLPAATNLREVSRRETTAENTEEGTTELTVYVTLDWDAPEGKDELGFQRYNVMTDEMQVAENNEEDGQSEEYELSMRGLKEMKVYIMTVYDYGYAFSDTITVEEMPSNIDLIPAISQGEGVIYNTQGQRVSADNYKGVIIINRKKYLIK